MMPMALATEDVLSEAIGLRLLGELPTPVTPGLLLRKDGFSYLRSGMNKWRQLAQRQIVLILTDLDQLACPITLKADWLGDKPAPANLMLRIAVREVESWVLADHEAMRKLIGNKGTLPPEPDQLPDPKQHLLKLAKLAARPIREDLVKETGAVASQGIGYNYRLTAWVRSEWSPERAAQRSPSLQRARMRLNELALRLKG
ncbi:MAG: hypothetical protein ABI642_15715 [Polaromonas sp.]